MVEHTWFLFPAIIPIAEMLAITSAYTIIRLHDELNVLMVVITGLFGFTAILMLNMGINFTVQMTLRSEEYSEPSYSCVKFTPADRKFFKSCCPIKLNIGNSFAFSRDTFICILDKIIVDSLINLLLAY